MMMPAASVTENDPLSGIAAFADARIDSHSVRGASGPPTRVPWI